jgi:hypothetical protein
MLSAAQSTAWPERIWDRPGDAALQVVDSGEVVWLPVRRWHGPVLAEEVTVLEKVESPALDVGCGPGATPRLLEASVMTRTHVTDGRSVWSD